MPRNKAKLSLPQLTPVNSQAPTPKAPVRPVSEVPHESAKDAFKRRLIKLHYRFRDEKPIIIPKGGKAKGPGFIRPQRKLLAV